MPLQEHRLLDGARDARGDGHGGGFVDAFHEHRELVAAEARGEVVGAKDGADAPADLAEQRIAGDVAERVVDDLESIDVEEEDGETDVAAQQRAIEPLQE